MSHDMIDIMVDTETLSTEPNAVVLSIGACEFNRMTGAIGEVFYTKIDSRDCVAKGQHVCSDTMAWWAKQSQEAQKEAFAECNVTLQTAMQEFKNWVIAVRDANPKKALHFWANDPDFDGVILQHSFKAVGMLPPWQYFEHRSVRTMKLLDKDLQLGQCDATKREGTHHNALDDAIHQATLVCNIYKALQAKQG